jgi:PKD repeat protein
MLSRMPRRLALIGGLAAIGLLSGPALAQASSTVVGFDNLTPGEEVKTQYEAEGVVFGKAEEAFGQKSPGEGDCGPPKVEEEKAALGISAHSHPNYALLQSCAPVGAQPSSGTYGKLTKHPRGSLSVWVRDLSLATPGGVHVSLTGYGSAGEVLASDEAEATTSGWTQVLATQPAGGNAQIAYFFIHTTAPTGDSIAIDDLEFEKVEETGSGGGGGGGGGTGGGGGGTGGGGSGGSGGGATPPAAVLSVASLARGGGLTTLSGASSTGGSSRIISYDWDFNHDGKIDTSTGANPVAHFIFTPGPHVVGLTVTNSEGQKSSTNLTIDVPHQVSIPPTVEGGEGECEPTYNEGEIELIAECIQRDEGGSGRLIETRQLELNGMVLTPQSGGYGVYHIQHFKALGIGEGVRLTGPAVDFELLNTPIGNVVLGGRNLEAEPVNLSFQPFNHQQVKVLLGQSLVAPNQTDGGPRARAADATKSLILSFAVGHECSGSDKSATCCPKTSNTSCATLPGGFPLGGQVNAYVSNKGQLLLNVQVALDLKSVGFEASGALEIIADAHSGIDLGSLQFTIPQASLAEIFKVEEASFTYYFPDNPEESKRDTWQAKGTIVFGPLGEPKMKGSLSFKKGQFHEASMTFTAPSGTGVPIYPGVLVNELGGTVGAEPLKFGGTLGASIATQLQLSLSFLYREESGEELGFFGGEGKLSFKDDEIATLAADVYSDGYTDAQLKINLHFPFDSKEPVIEVAGQIGFWDEPESGRWEANGEVHLKLWVINAEVAGLVDNNYAAGCLAAFGGGIQGRYRFSDGNVSGGVFGFKSCSDELKQYKEVPLKKHNGGFVKEESLIAPRTPLALGAPLTPQAPLATSAAAGGETITVPSGQFGEELLISSSSGTPLVSLTSPDGKTYTTPVNPNAPTGVDGQFIAAVAPNQHEVMVLLMHPQGGSWTLTPAPGSPAIARVQEAKDVPPAQIRAKVRKRHGKWALSYRISNYVKGSTVRFIERGRDSDHVIATVHNASGTVRFTPQEALARRRKIIADISNAEGVPRRTVTVGSFKASPAIRGGRVKRLRFSRHGQTTAVLSWAPTPGARGYRVKIRGTDGRLVTELLPAKRHSVTLQQAFPWDGYTASVRAIAGKNLLKGPTAHAQLRVEKLTRPKIVVLHGHNGGRPGHSGKRHAKRHKK